MGAPGHRAACLSCEGVCVVAGDTVAARGVCDHVGRVSVSQVWMACVWVSPPSQAGGQDALWSVTYGNANQGWQWGPQPLDGPFLPSLSLSPAASPPSSVVLFFLPTGASHHP